MNFERLMLLTEEQLDTVVRSFPDVGEISLNQFGYHLEGIESKCPQLRQKLYSVHASGIAEHGIVTLIINSDYAKDLVSYMDNSLVGDEEQQLFLFYLRSVIPIKSSRRLHKNRLVMEFHGCNEYITRKLWGALLFMSYRFIHGGVG